MKTSRCVWNKNYFMHFNFSITFFKFYFIEISLFLLFLCKNEKIEGRKFVSILFTSILIIDSIFNNIYTKCYIRETLLKDLEDEMNKSQYKSVRLHLNYLWLNRSQFVYIIDWHLCTKLYYLYIYYYSLQNWLLLLQFRNLTL